MLIKSKFLDEIADDICLFSREDLLAWGGKCPASWRPGAHHPSPEKGLCETPGHRLATALLMMDSTDKPLWETTVARLVQVQLSPIFVRCSNKCMIVLLLIQEEPVKWKHIASSRIWTGTTSWVRKLLLSLICRIRKLSQVQRQTHRKTLSHVWEKPSCIDNRLLECLWRFIAHGLTLEMSLSFLGRDLIFQNQLGVNFE